MNIPYPFHAMDQSEEEIENNVSRRSNTNTSLKVDIRPGQSQRLCGVG